MRIISPFSFFSNRFNFSRGFHSILEGKFNYNEAFRAFVAATPQKKETALIVGAFGKKLQKYTPVQSAPLKVADFGCADAITGIQYLKNINHPLGYEYVGVDTNEEFLNKAVTSLVQEPSIKKHRLIKEDALSGKLSKHSAFLNQTFDLIFVSHTAYYLKEESSGYLFLKDLLQLLSKNNGIALFLHEDTTHHYRQTYNPQFKRESTPALLEKYSRYATLASNQLQTLRFTSKLSFPLLKESLWKAAINPEEYKKHSHDLNFINTLNKLAFIVQRDLKALAEEGTLSNYIDEVRRAIKQEDGFPITTHLQILANPQCAHSLNMTKILKELREELPDILKQAYPSSPGLFH